jgi:hypothetical protein
VWAVSRKREKEEVNAGRDEGATGGRGRGRGREGWLPLH